jgi:hypothetical protein
MEWDFVKFIAQALISVAGAFLAAHLAGKRFRTDKWWERKAAAYGELVEALHQMKWVPGEYVEAEITDRKVPEDDAKRYWDQYKVAYRNVWRIADHSSFLVSPKVLAAIQEMERAIGKAREFDNWFEHIEAEYNAISACLECVKALGREELGIQDA